MNQVENPNHARTPATKSIAGGFGLGKLLPIGILAAGIVAFFAFGLDEYLTIDALRENRGILMEFVADNPMIAPLLFMALYSAAVVFSFPGAMIMTISGGFLFGSVLGTAWVVLSATLGATILFVIAKTSLGDLLRAKAGPWLKKMENGFRENALSYLLVLRLIPLFPFFVVNLAPAFLGVRLRTYVIGTLVGIVPGSFVYATVGAGLGSIFDKNQIFAATGIVTPEIITALVGLAVLSLIPIAYKKMKVRRPRGGRNSVRANG